MFQTVLIANRGAIAVRILRTLKVLGVRSVAVYAEADAQSPHVVQADLAFSLGEGSVAETYLNQEKLLQIVAQAEVDAVHPGYGFLSENAGFCRALEDLGVAFIGPTAEQMRAFGLKHEARTLARAQGVPLLPGSELLPSCEQALVQAEQVGYPLMLKSTAGGGGIGLQVCRDGQQLQQAWQSIERLSTSHFGHSGIFLEKYIEQARHVEVQVFGDGQGNALVLGDRDCSAQRRHQKVIEEAPAPGIPDSVREQMHGVARALVTSVAYRNAGTVEFIYDAQQHRFYFLEVNTRLQVEHGVTEMIFGINLVEWMIRLAAGELPAINTLEETLQARGHAVQARLYAENPSHNFQPCAGTLNAVYFPPEDRTHVRFDHWLMPGLSVSPLFDPMLAKVMAWGETRDQALASLSETLSQVVLEGIETNKDYVQAVLESSAMGRGALHTRFLQDFAYTAWRCDVLNGGTMTTVQDYPGRVGYWHVGVPPSGPFDSYAFRLGNRLLGNHDGAAGLEITLNGPTLKFHCCQRLVLTGAPMAATLDGQPLAFYQVFEVQPGQVLALSGLSGAGARAYCLFAGGLQCEPYLNSRATFTLGQFGGLTGRALRGGDVLHLSNPVPTPASMSAPASMPSRCQRDWYQREWQVRVVYGPHGAPDFFTEEDIRQFFATDWRVHYNSSRTGVRLIGPKPQWARTDGGGSGYASLQYSRQCLRPGQH